MFVTPPLLAWAFVVDRPVYTSVFVERSSGKWIPPGHLKHGHWKATTGVNPGHDGGKIAIHGRGDVDIKGKAHGGGKIDAGGGSKGGSPKHSSSGGGNKPAPKSAPKSSPAPKSSGGSKGGGSPKSGGGGGSKGGSGGGGEGKK